jgi:hypothetical protein
MKIFFDTEFTQLQKDADLISIGMVAENGETFYAEFSDYSNIKVNDWLEKNVINNLSKCTSDLETFARCTIYGDKLEISKYLHVWLSQFKFDKIEFVSDVCHYDFVLLIDLITDGNTALDMPHNISPICHDINYDIAKFFGISEEDAFNKSREEILEYFKTYINGGKHNAMYDALVIAMIYKVIQLHTPKLDGDNNG